MISTIIETLDELKAQDITILDFKENPSSIYDTFVICTGTSVTHTKAMAEKLIRNLRTNHSTSAIPEGLTQGNWVLIDLFDIVVHILTPDTREYYDLESMWGDSPKRPYEDFLSDRPQMITR